MTPAAGVPRDATIAVIGSGAMGAGIAQIAAQAGHPVRLFDTRMGAAEKARSTIAQTLQTLAQKGRLAAADATASAARIVAVHALGDCVSAALVIEAIVEDLAEKRTLLRELEKIVPAQAILATNTSSLSVTALGAGLRHPGRFAGMHFFNPVPLMKLVEIVAGLATDPATTDALAATAIAWGKDPVHATSTPGFIVNRCARPFYGEALRLLAERAAEVATIDAVLRSAGGFRMGPFELMDLIGNDVNFAVTRGVWEACYHDPRYAPSVQQNELVAAGFLGRKSGRGFYDYSVDSPPPQPATLDVQSFDGAVTSHGDPGILAPLVARLVAAGVDVQQRPALAGFPDGALSAGNVVVALSDGRTATSRASATSTRNLVLVDLARDYSTCEQLAVAASDGCSVDAFNAAAAVVQRAGIRISRFDDVAGLAVLRIVATLANEAADAVTHGVASAADVDVAMQKGVNYPCGPLRWADEVGIGRIRDVLQNLAAHYGEDRYRLSPLIARRFATGERLAAGTR